MNMFEDPMIAHQRKMRAAIDSVIKARLARDQPQRAVPPPAPHRAPPPLTGWRSPEFGGKLLVAAWLIIGSLGLLSERLGW